MSTLPPRLPISETHIYKEVGLTHIRIDVYTPTIITPSRRVANSAVLYIHGGGWTGGDRSDYSPPLFRYLLDHGLVIFSMDYRLLPETSGAEQRRDLTDVEPYIRNWVKDHLHFGCDPNKILVIGASAGGQLALSTPRLWKLMPVGLVALYAPTNMLNIKYQRRDLCVGKSWVEPTPDQIKDALTEVPPSGLPPARTDEERSRPRCWFGRRIFELERVAEMLVEGLHKDSYGQYHFPSAGSVSPEKITAISPIHCVERGDPPTSLVMLEKDLIFKPEVHVTPYQTELERAKVPCIARIVQGEGHAFDTYDKELRLEVREVLDFHLSGHR